MITTTTNIKWTKKMIRAEAQKYKTRSEWEREDSRSYGAAFRKGYLDIACKHMEVIRTPKGYWTPALVLLDAKKYKTRTDWNRNSFTAYRTAKFLKIFERCVEHMKKKK